MAFKFLILSAVLAVASAGVIGQAYVAPALLTKVANPAVDAVASTHQNVVRSFGGTVSQYSKTIDTPYSSVHKEDTRVSNNVYTPAIANTVTYAAPAPTAAVYTHATPVVSKSYYSAPTPVAYNHHAHEAAPAYQHYETAPTAYHQEAPAVYTQHEVAPTAAVYTHAAPAKTVSYAAPTPVYHHAAPTQVYHHAAPTATTTYNHGPAASTYTHNAPGVAAYGSSQTVHYSPAEMVSHMSFDGFGTHWGF